MHETGPQAPQRLLAGRYRLVRVVGRGAAGIVWQADDELIDREVAVKELRPPPALTAEERDLFNQRALREARSGGRVRHRAVIAIHDIVPASEDDDAVYLVMEFVRAPTLAELLRQDGPLPAERVTSMGLQVLEALEAAHSIGVVHRDVKPGNIMVLPGDEVKLVDFGIAQAADDTRLTRSGVAGSTGYMAPELFHGEHPTPATDLWALGATLYHALTGAGPFDRDSAAATMHAVLYEDPSELPAGSALSEVITGLLIRAPDERMTGQEVRARLAATSPRPEPVPAQQEPDQPEWAAHSTTTNSTARPGPEAGKKADWETNPTTVSRKVPPPVRRNPRKETLATNPPGVVAATIVSQVVLGTLSVGLMARLASAAGREPVETLVVFAPLVLLALMMVIFLCLPSRRWTVAPGARGVLVHLRGRKEDVEKARVAWDFLDTIAVAPAGRNRTRVTAHVSADPGYPYNAFATKGDGNVLWSLGDVHGPVDVIEKSFRDAAPRAVRVVRTEDAGAPEHRHPWPRPVRFGVVSIVLVALHAVLYFVAPG